MTTSASVYFNKIDITYPVTGRDNDSQRFRDNFNNIKLALQETDGVVTSLKLGLVTTSTVNNFGFNTIKRANFQDCSTNVYDDTQNVRSQAVAVNYSNGSYQKFRIANGNTTFNVINWPYKVDNPNGLQGSIILSITPETTAYTTIDFGSYVPVGDTNLPFTFDSAETAFFHLWSDDSGATVYINFIGYKTGIVATGTTLIATDSIKIGTNTYRTGTDFKTVVYVDTGTNIKVGDIAVLKNIFNTLIDPSTEYQVGSTVSNYFVVENSTGIFPGATVNFTGTNTAYIVDYIEPGTSTTTNTATVYTTNFFSINPAPFSTSSIVTFANPTFDNLPIILSLTTATITSTTGQAGDFKGSVYVNSSSLFVAFDDYGNTSTNWVKFYDANYIDNSVDKSKTAGQLATGTTAITVSTATDSQVIATTEFVHNVLPKRSIIMWGGEPQQIPWGWALCDGTTVNGVITPDLRNRFIIGANSSSGATAVTTITGSGTTTGGSADSTLISHTHSATTTVPDHNHPITASDGANYVGAPPYAISFGFGGADGAIDGSMHITPAERDLVSFGVGNTSLSPTTTITATGSGNGTNQNLPPYYALCYIIKVI